MISRDQKRFLSGRMLHVTVSSLFLSLPSKTRFFAIRHVWYVRCSTYNDSTQLITIETNAEAGSSKAAIASQLASLAARSHQNPTIPNAAAAPPAKLAKNKRLPATMITPAGQIEASKKKGKQESSKKKKRTEKGKERALELSQKLESKVRDREDKKVSAWDLLDGRRRASFGFVIRGSGASYW
jgi:hypothetical protein